MSRSRRLMWGLLVGCGVLLVAEGLVRLVVSEESLLFIYEKPNGMIELLGDQVYVRASGKHTLADGPYPWKVVTNSQGLREDVEIAAAKPAGTTRYLALGDSWVFGSSVNQGHTLSDQLEARLADRGAGEVEVINGGIPGGSGFEMLVRWSELSTVLELDGVILGVPHNNNRQKEFANSRSKLYQPPDGAPYAPIRLYLLARRMMVPWTRVRAPPVGWQGDADDGGALHDVEYIAQEAVSRNMKVWGVDWPHIMIDAVARTSAPAMRWREVLGEAGVVFAGHALNTRACWGFVDHDHPSEAGIRAVAEVVADVMMGTPPVDYLHTNPSCDEVEGAGPGKPGWLHE